MQYGIPYQGSKSKICNALLAHLPDGNRFVDLFGGGFAMSHAALLSGKYNKVLYNDVNKLLPPLIEDAIAGKYNYKNFTPEFISRERFYELKDKDGYIKYVWSFSNDGEHYLYGKDVEETKRLIHNWIVYGEYDKKLCIPKQYIDLMKAIDIKDTRKRRLTFKKIKGLMSERSDLQYVESIERLQHLERLEQCEHLQRIERLQHLELTSNNYLSYEYQLGDVVYCDPPYENTSDYGVYFDSQRFYDWVATRKYSVYFSSYKISDDRFKIIYCKLKTCLKSVHAKRKNVTECLYWNGVDSNE